MYGSCPQYKQNIIHTPMTHAFNKNANERHSIQYLLFMPCYILSWICVDEERNWNMTSSTIAKILLNKHTRIHVWCTLCVHATWCIKHVTVHEHNVFSTRRFMRGLQYAKQSTQKVTTIPLSMIINTFCRWTAVKPRARQMTEFNHVIRRWLLPLPLILLANWSNKKSVHCGLRLRQIF